MKTWTLAIVALGLGLAVGGGRAWSEFARARTFLPGEGRAPSSDVPIAVESPTQREFPKLVLEGGTWEDDRYIHDFGVMRLEDRGRHTFIFRNEGTAPLLLEDRGSTCSCTIAQIAKEGIPPGGSSEVVLEWTPKDYTDHFLHSAQIGTNDPERRHLRLSVKGRVTRGVRVVPGDLVFESVSASEPHTASAIIYDYHTGHVEVSDIRLENPELAEFFDVTVQPLAPEAVAKELGAKGGLAVDVTLKPGLPLGPISQTIRLALTGADVPELELPVRGRLVGDITFLAAGYDAARGVLRLGAVPADRGVAKTLHAMIKGPYRRDVQLKIGKIVPEGILQAELGPPREPNASVIMVPLEIKVPPGTDPVVYSGIRTEEMGRIELETSHPDTPKVIVYVSFLVEKSR